jgi:hypothetical protein
MLRHGSRVIEDGLLAEVCSSVVLSSLHGPSWSCCDGRMGKGRKNVEKDGVIYWWWGEKSCDGRWTFADLLRTFCGGEMDVRWDEKFELVYKYG